MKELSIEEKAQRYDEAIERAKGVIEQNPLMEYLKKGIEYIFPELKESEDERMARELIAHFRNNSVSETWSGLNVKKVIAWLEKQGEHANFRNKIQIGDKVTRNEDGVLVNLSQLERVAKPAENKGEHDMGISETTKQKLEDNLYKALEKETPESCNEFLEKQGEQKPAEWSEEDKKMIHYIENAIKYDKSRTYLNSKGIEIKNVCDWLKYLKRRYTWKPSDMQMHYLSWIANVKLGDSVVEQEVSKHLNELLEDLKKLREK